MVKDSSGSHDGWFWSNPAKGQCVVDNHRYPFDHPVSGFGHYCVRCHAATQSPGAEPAERGERVHLRVAAEHRRLPGRADPLPGRRLVASRTRGRQGRRRAGDDRHDPHPQCARPDAAGAAGPRRRPAIPGPLRLDQARRARGRVASCRRSPTTGSSAAATASQEFVTSNQCMSCHAGLVAPFGPSMFVPTGDERGVRGRRPGRLALRRMALDADGPGGPRPDLLRPGRERDPLAPRGVPVRPGARRRARARRWPTPACAATGRWASGSSTSTTRRARRSSRSTTSTRSPAPTEHPGHGAAKYGALARDGVGCVVCHRMQPRAQPADDRRPYLQYFLETSITGNFHLGKKGEIYGPFRDDEIAPYAMEHATGLKPKHSDFLKSSQLCGTCHTVALPTVDRPLDPSRPEHRRRRADRGPRSSRCSGSSTTTSSRRPTWSGSTANTRTRSTRRTRRPGRARIATCRAG